MKTTETLSPSERSRIAKAVSQRFRSQNEQALDSSIVKSQPDVQSKPAFTFVLGGCQYPAGLLDVEPAYDAYARLANRLETGEITAAGLILTGDQIYADATAGLFDPTQLVDHYRRSYERLLQKKPVREVMRQIPVISMFDDHEISDNYEPINSSFHPDKSCQQQERLGLALKQYIYYQRGSGPYPDGKTAEIKPEKLWYEVNLSGLPVFVTNTRSDRQWRTATSENKARIMGAGQTDALKHWLLTQDESLPKIVVSPSIFLPRHTRILQSNKNSNSEHNDYPLLSDSWDGYPASLYDLLAFISDNSILNVIFVSGDEHLGCASKAVIDQTGSASVGLKPVSIHSIHTSALYAPYPFANACKEDLIKRETFSFKNIGMENSENPYRCTYSTEFYSGFGFTVIKLTKNSRGEWEINCEFDREKNSGNYKAFLT